LGVFENSCFVTARFDVWKLSLPFLRGILEVLIEISLNSLNALSGLRFVRLLKEESKMWLDDLRADC
jgi:hypothetical protein